MRLPKLSRRNATGIALSILAILAGLYAVMTSDLPQTLGGQLARAGEELGLVARRVEIEGQLYLADADLRAAIGPLDGRPMAEIDLTALRRRIEALPQVASVEVSRLLPDRVLIRIAERQPFALWQHDRRLAIVDREGVVLTREDLARWRHLPLLVGAGAPESAPALLAMLETSALPADEIEAAIRVGDRRWDIKLRNGLLVRLPAQDSEPGWGEAEAWERFAALVREHRLDARDITLVDLRIADRLVVRLSPEGRLLAVAAEQST